MRFSIQKSRSTQKMIVVINGRIKIGEISAGKVITAESDYWKRKMIDSKLTKKYGYVIN